MKIYAVGIMMAVATFGYAEEVEKVSLKVAATVTQACNPDKCSITVKVSGGMNGQATIAPATVAQFGPSTEIDIEPPVLGSSALTLGDDPNYSPGDTSATFVEIMGMGDIVITITTNLSWKNGKFVVKQKYKGKGSQSEPHVDTTTEKLLPSIQTVKVAQKSHPIEIITFAIVANNGGPDIYDVDAGLLPDFKRAVIEEQKGKQGEVKETEQVIYKAKQLVPLPII